MLGVDGNPSKLLLAKELGGQMMTMTKNIGMLVILLQILHAVQVSLDVVLQTAFTDTPFLQIQSRTGIFFICVTNVPAGKEYLAMLWSSLKQMGSKGIRNKMFGCCVKITFEFSVYEMRRYFASQMASRGQKWC